MIIHCPAWNRWISVCPATDCHLASIMLQIWLWDTRVGHRLASHFHSIDQSCLPRQRAVDLDSALHFERLYIEVTCLWPSIAMSLLAAWLHSAVCRSAVNVQSWCGWLACADSGGCMQVSGQLPRYYISRLQELTLTQRLTIPGYDRACRLLLKLFLIFKGWGRCRWLKPHLSQWSMMVNQGACQL